MCKRAQANTPHSILLLFPYMYAHVTQTAHSFVQESTNKHSKSGDDHTHTHWSQSRAASYQVGDGWRMRSVLRGIQTLWKRPVVVSECVCVSLLRCSPLMISSTHSQSFSNLHTGAHRGENAAGDSLLEELHNVSMLICDQAGCE